MFKQIIIARKDLQMSPGKLAAQVAHGSNAFLLSFITKNTVKIPINMYPTYTRAQTRSTDLTTAETSEDIVMYKRLDLYELAKKADKEGKFCFFAGPVDPNDPYGDIIEQEPKYEYRFLSKLVNHENVEQSFDKDIYEQWIMGEYTKTVLKAKNKNQLLKAKTMAEELGMKENEDFFLIYDNCHTELEPEEESGKTLTVIGFKPMDCEIIDKIGKKFQLY